MPRVRKVFDEPTHVPARKTRKPKFDPSSKYINEAVEEYLKRGGKITRLIIEEETPVEIISNYADSHLNPGLELAC